MPRLPRCRRKISSRDVLVGALARARSVGRPGLPLRHAIAPAISRRCSTSARCTASLPRRSRPSAIDGERVSSTRIRDALASRRFRNGRAVCSAAVTRSADASCAATSSAARSAIPTANLRFGGKRTAAVGDLRGAACTALARSPCPLWPASARGPTVGGARAAARSAPVRFRWRPVRAPHRRSNSSRSCATNGPSPTCRRWSSRCIATRRRRALLLDASSRQAYA